MTNAKPRVKVAATSRSMADGFANVVTGLGMNNAKVAAHSYSLAYNQIELENAYRTSTWFGKIVEIPADDAVREWRLWNAPKAQVELLDATEARLQVVQKVRQAIIYQRLYGGAVIIPIGLSGDLSQPLRMESIAKDSIKALTVLSRNEINAEGLITDPLSPLYGQPERYVINTQGGASYFVHPSRVIRFNGRVANQRSTGSDSWGDSIWSHMSDSVMAADAASAVLDALMQEAKIDVISIDNLIQNLASPDAEQAFINRFNLVAALKSITNISIIDGSDKWEQKTINWAGLPDVCNHLLNVMAGSADIPMSRLTGKQESGLSGKDEGSLRNYYDSVKAKQKLQIQPSLSHLDEMLIRSATGSRDPAIWYEWVSLFQMSENEKSEIDKRDAETAQIYALSGLVPSEALEATVQNRMIESGRWPGLEDALAAVKLETDLPNEDDLSVGKANLGDAAPRSLYLRRDVVNSDEITKWAKSQGFATVQGGLHVTVIHTRTPIDWIKVGNVDEYSTQDNGNITVPAGGPRLMERFGDAVVLQFASSNLAWRHEAIKHLGAETDYPEYQPHITISWQAADLDLSKVEPYQGKIILGPEVFSEVRDDWKSTIIEDGQ